MTHSTWMLYRASGFTGRMIAEEAIRRGHHPILAGRSAERIRPLAESLHLPWRAADLASPDALQEALQGVDAILLTASPFQQTAPALVQACLATGTSYADIANEIERLLGKRDLAVRHDEGWTYPCQVAEALEALDETPLPARYGYWGIPGGVSVEVVVRNATPDTRCLVQASLWEHGVPVQEVSLLERRDQLRRPMPLRGDLREQLFSGATKDHPLMMDPRLC
jgi:NAD(P)-dependent dehydrogenase (short-subunit alcohol dehydrogenase family)